jgi:hypothetical protein
VLYNVRVATVQMNWKRAVLIGVGWGLGTAVGLALIVGGFLWYENRPKPPVPPKPWNASAIKAEYDLVGTETNKEKQNVIVFYYTLENTTDFDFRVEDGQHITITGKLKDEKSLTPFLKPAGVIDYPIFVPAKKRVRIEIHLVGYTYPVKQKDNPTAEERKQYRAMLAKYVADEFPNLDGFDLLDGENRYEIVLPGGWKETKKEAAR